MIIENSEASVIMKSADFSYSRLLNSKIIVFQAAKYQYLLLLGLLVA